MRGGRFRGGSSREGPRQGWAGWHTSKEGWRERRRGGLVWAGGMLACWLAGWQFGWRSTKFSLRHLDAMLKPSSQL